MEIINNKEEVPFSYYADLFAKADPAEISRRLGLPFAEGGFALRLLGKDYQVSHPDAVIAPAAPIPVQTFLLRYLLEGKAVPFRGEFKTFREMPWGELYIKPYTGRVLTRAAFTFGTRVEAFRAAGQRLGGLPLSHGDAGFEFNLIGDYRIRLQVWAGDEEFPPNAQMLYSDNFAEGFAAEDRVVAGDLLISYIKSGL